MTDGHHGAQETGDGHAHDEGHTHEHLAFLLLDAGHPDLAVLDGGPDQWAAATGRPLQTGS